jgi:hypothetical protein
MKVARFQLGVSPMSKSAGDDVEIKKKGHESTDVLCGREMRLCTDGSSDDDGTINAMLAPAPLFARYTRYGCNFEH